MPKDLDTAFPVIRRERVHESFKRQRYALLVHGLNRALAAQIKSYVNMSLGKTERFFQADVRGRKRFFSNIILSTPFSIGKIHLFFFGGRGRALHG